MPVKDHSASVSELPAKERLISERFRIIGLAWADAESAFALLDELKTTTLEQMKSKLMAERGDMPDSHATRIVKSTPEWESYVREMCAAGAKARSLKVKMEALRMEHTEWTSKDANARAEMRLGRY
jgi:hypothetical protein